MSGAPVIEIEHLCRRFGRLRAVDDVSLAVDEGEILGFLGPNGAGKTTTVRVLMGFLRPTAGSCRVLGRWPGDGVDVRSRIGYLPGDGGPTPCPCTGGSCCSTRRSLSRPPLCCSSRP
jgi:ABC-2 type transport system ATP-binding protein